MSDVLRFDKYQEIFQKTLRSQICFFAQWELTYQCNLQCRHCYVAACAQKKEFSLAKAISIIDELKKMNCLYLALSGGEILCRRDFFEIASHASAQGFAIRLMTNATLINEPFASRIAGLHPLAVDISIYAASARLHDRITGVRGSFANALAAASLLKAHNLAINFKCLLMKDNVQELTGVRQLAAAYGAQLLLDSCVVGKDDGSRKPLRWRLDKAQLKSLYERGLVPPEKTESDSPSILCSAGLNSICISPYLDVYPCVGLKIKLGNLYKESLAQIWKSSRNLQTLRQLKDSDLSTCFRCRIKQHCFRCPGIAHAQDHDLLGPSNYDCSVAKILYKLRAKERR